MLAGGDVLKWEPILQLPARVVLLKIELVHRENLLILQR